MKEVDTSYRDKYEDSPFNHYVGFKVAKLNVDDVELKLKVEDKHLNMNSTLHGGVYATMLDVVLGMAITSVTHKSAITISLNINYLAPALVHENLYAKAKIIQKGYKIIIVEGEIYNEANEILTKGIGTFKVNRES